MNSVRAMHLVEEESILHLAFSTGLYCRLDLRGQEEPATRTVLSLNSAEAGGEAASWHAQFGQPEGAGSLLLFAISSQGKSKNFAIGSNSSKSSQILLFLLKKRFSYDLKFFSSCSYIGRYIHYQVTGIP